MRWVEEALERLGLHEAIDVRAALGRAILVAYGPERIYPGGTTLPFPIWVFLESCSRGTPVLLSAGSRQVRVAL